MASITFRCSSCNHMLRAGAEKAGKRVKCGKCGAIVTVPDEVATAEVIEPTELIEPASSPPTRKRAPAPRDDADFEAGPPPRRHQEEDSAYEEPPRRGRRAIEDDADDDYGPPRQRRRHYDDDNLDRIRKGPGPARPTGMVTLIGVLNLLFAGVFIVSCIAFMVAGSTLLNMMTGMTEKAIDQFPAGDPRAKQAAEHGKDMMRGMAAMGTFVFMLSGSCAVVLVGVPLIFAGVGVLKRRQWGRVLALILGFLAMLGAAGLVYQLWPLNRYAWISVGITFAYGVITFIILLIPTFAAEFE